MKTVDQLGALSKGMHDNSGIITSSFGIGSDFQFEVMDAIAKNGHGSYFFVSFFIYFILFHIIFENYSD